MAGAHFVLVGEASHGTHEFYRERAEITKRLIVEKDFRAVAVEADPTPTRSARGAGDVPLRRLSRNALGSLNHVQL